MCLKVFRPRVSTCVAAEYLTKSEKLLASDFVSSQRRRGCVSGVAADP